jgi:hypothetical protein
LNHVPLLLLRNDVGHTPHLRACAAGWPSHLQGRCIPCSGGPRAHPSHSTYGTLPVERCAQRWAWRTSLIPLPRERLSGFKMNVLVVPVCKSYWTRSKTL